MAKYIIITDLEPDDWMALLLTATLIPAKHVLFVGTVLLDSGVRKTLAERILQELNYSVPVIQGSGGNPEDYEDIGSSRAAREYTHTVESPKHTNPIKSDDLKNAIRSALNQYDNLEFVFLAPPTDLVAVLQEDPSLKKKIKHIHVMGGWVSIAPDVHRTTYNWNMDPVASAALVQMNDIPMTLFSSHLIKAAFQGGSINRANYPQLIDKIDTLIPTVPALQKQRLASTKWNQHLIQRIPVLANIIGPYVDHQFTPADPIVIISLVYPELITEKRPVTLKIILDDKDPNRGFRISVDAVDDASSKISVVEKMDLSKFIEGFNRMLDRLSGLHSNL